MNLLLKEKALHSFPIPAQYEMIIEDYSENRAFFIWGNPNNEQECISVSFTKDGVLQEYTNYSTEKILKNESIEVLEKVTKDFIQQYYPNLLQSLSFTEIKDLGSSVRFKFRQDVEGVKMKGTGISITVRRDGKIVECHYKGLFQKPIVPSQFLTKQEFLQQLREHCHVSLCVIRNKEGDFQTAYYAKDISQYYDVTEPTWGKKADELYVSVTTPQQNYYSTFEEWIGIDETFNKEEILDKNEMKVVYRKIELPTNYDTVENILAKKRESVTVIRKQLDMNRMINLYSYQACQIEQPLSLEECYDRAIAFLHFLYKDADTYFKEVSNLCELKKDQILFTFRPFIGDLPVLSETLVIVINRQNGLVNYFSNITCPIEHFRRISEQVQMNHETAKQKWLSGTDVRLEWERIYFPIEKRTHKLMYHIVTPSFFISAKDGQFINAFGES